MNKVIASLLMIGVVAAMAGAGTFAYFSSTATSVDNTFTAGTVVIENGTATYSADINNMAPCDTETVTLNATSMGSLPLEYNITTTLTGAVMLGESGGADDPYVSEIRVDGVAYSDPETMTELGGTDDVDEIQIDITLPCSAGNNYQGLSGDLEITFDAVQQ